MELTGKAKEQFEKWLKKQSFNRLLGQGDKWIVHNFYTFPDSMKYGVYVDFFDSEDLKVEILISPIANTMYSTKYDYSIFRANEEIYSTSFELDTRQEARTSAITKANEILNEQLNK